MRRFRSPAAHTRVVCAVLFFALCAATAVPATAHMFYLEPRLVTGNAADTPRLVVDVKVGHPFDAEVLPRMAHHLDQFVAVDLDGNITQLVGVDGRAPAGVTGWSGEPHLVTYRSHAVTHRMKRAGFLRYGEEEGVGHLMATQPAAPEGVEDERYYRCAKTLVGIPLDSDVGDALASRAVECDLDIEALGNGERRGAFRVLFRGEPVPFVQIRLSGRGGDEQTMRTDAAGRVDFDLSSGRWLLSAVHLEPLGVGQWQSWWASFLFDVEGDVDGEVDSEVKFGDEPLTEVGSPTREAG